MLKIISDKNYKTSSIIISINTGYGNFDGSPLVPHLLEHLLFTPVIKDLERMGCDTSYVTSVDVTYYQIVFHKRYLDEVLSIIKKVTDKLLVTDEVFEKEKRILLEEMSVDGDDNIFFNKINEKLKDKTGINFNWEDSKEVLENISIEDIRLFFESEYIKKGFSFVYVGAADEATVLDKIKDLNINKGDEINKIEGISNIKRGVINIDHKEDGISILNFVLFLENVNNSEVIAINTIIGITIDRVFRDGEEFDVYDQFSYVDTFRSFSKISVEMTLDKDDKEKVINKFFEVFDNLEIEDDLLESTVNTIELANLMTKQSPKLYASELATETYKRGTESFDIKNVFNKKVKGAGWIVFHF